MDILETACLVAARREEEKSAIAFKALELTGAQDRERSYRLALKAIDRLVEIRYLHRPTLGVFRLEDAGREALKIQGKFLRVLADLVQYGT